ncbi:YCF48-related protein [uncultured Mucilaginibacter sp.]|uniref:WD40/YVTN/BNR-like repeat-containing protein n=1 Tax=uncultured Mucilaginibacter sp. TaxID=797541 RepID=UPI0025F611A0|nr:YCF48-related protein [uncultured Mucilaginibacter sp.]
MMKNFFKYAVLTSCLLLNLNVNAQSISLLQQGNPTSIRGLSVVDDNVAWVSGSKGTIAKTSDGGKTWNWQTVKGFEKADFRDIEAFSDKEAIIMSSGTPALILKTTDGGTSWNVKYSNIDTAYFFDAMDFADKKHGYILGDPINNKFVLMETQDGGETWAAYNNPPDALPGEAAFAASGTCLRIVKGAIGISSGGTNTRFIYFNITLGSWQYDPLPIVHHKSSQGAFSFAMAENSCLFVGGDYADDKKTDSVAAVALPRLDATLNYYPVKTGPLGFQSCIEYIAGNTFLSTGTPGSNITTDGGKTWAKIDDTSFNVCRKAKHGKLVLFAGNGGKIGIFKP